MPAKILQMPKPAEVTLEEYEEFGRLEDVLDQAKPRHEQLRKKILAAHPDLKPEQGASKESPSYVIEISPKGEERSIKSIPALQKFLGIRRFLKIASVTLKAFESEVAADDRGQFISKERTGSRRVSAIKKLKEAA